MKLTNFLSSFLLVAVVPVSLAGTAFTFATKDSTILRSTVSCPSCPNYNCYKCTLGHETTLQAKTGGLSYVRMLIGFEIPVASSRITQCTVQLAKFIQPLEYSVNVTVAEAVSSEWNEATVTGENAPDSGQPFNSISVLSFTDIGSIDVTQACKHAAKDGKFSIYIGTLSGLIEIWSADAGYPAILNINYT